MTREAAARSRFGDAAGAGLIQGVGMKAHGSVLDAIGNTPLVKLKRASEETGCTILGKAEFLNPGQS